MQMTDFDDVDYLIRKIYLHIGNSAKRHNIDAPEEIKAFEECVWFHLFDRKSRKERSQNKRIVAHGGQAIDFKLEKEIDEFLS